MKLPGEAFNISYLVVSMVFDANLPTKLHDNYKGIYSFVNFFVIIFWDKIIDCTNPIG